MIPVLTILALVSLGKVAYDTYSEEKEANSAKKEQEKVLFPMIEKIKVFKEYFKEKGETELMNECDDLMKDINTKDKHGGIHSKVALSEEKFANVTVRFQKLATYDNYTRDFLK